MSYDVHLKYINDAYIKIDAEPWLVREISDQLTFFAPNYKFHPKYKARAWDGKINLVNNISGHVYAGLFRHIIDYCLTKKYNITVDDLLFNADVSVDQVRQFIADQGLPDSYEVRDYQLDALVKALRTRRRTLESPTSSGKSLIIYLLMRWYQKRTLIIVPSTGLVAQMKSDFEEYGYTQPIICSTGGRTDRVEEDCYITTWQSVHKIPKQQKQQWLNQFDVVIGDEAHNCQAASLIGILSNMTSTKYRFGLTGTLPQNDLSRNTIIGLFGPVYNVTTTKKLMEQGHVADLKIKAIVLRHTKEVVDQVKQISNTKDKKSVYAKEVKQVLYCPKRMQFIKNLALSLKGNTLILFRYQAHGKEIFNLLVDHVPNLYYIDKDTPAAQREQIRHNLNVQPNAIGVVSFATTATGYSVKNIHNIISASPTKGRIRLLQSIGRVLRTHESKVVATFYDIVDDASYNKKNNLILHHFHERAKIYDAEQLPYKIYGVKL